VKNLRIVGFVAVCTMVFAGCDRQGQVSGSGKRPRSITLVEARRGFVTKLPRGQESRERVPVDVPPADAPFRLVRYSSGAGRPELPAYLSVAPADGKKRPGIVWITGGDCNSIGAVWGDAPPDNDQTARAFRDAGVVMLFPALRGGNDTPGSEEGFLGEVDDVIAAGEFLAGQAGVDPRRIYLGGHSTGGTLVLLVAECSARFRAVFSFGPVESPANYGPDQAVFDLTNRVEVAVRSPILWLGDVKSPTFVIEGARPRGNAGSLRAMRRVNANPAVRFIELQGGNHFTILRPVERVLAGKIMADDGRGIDVTEAELEEALKDARGRGQ